MTALLGGKKLLGKYGLSTLASCRPDFNRLITLLKIISLDQVLVRGAYRQDFQVLTCHTGYTISDEVNDLLEARSIADLFQGWLEHSSNF